MTDVHDKETRSYNMSRINSRDTKPELIVRKFLFAKGYRYRLCDKKLPGKPDIVLPRYRTLIFVHGCFWHGHRNCAYFVVPKTRTAFWMNKIETNRHRDEQHMHKLSETGWKVLTIFECELKGAKQDITLNRLLKQLNKPADKQNE